MRSLLTSILALIVSLFVGELIAQILAVESGGREEWIVVFGFAMLVAAAVTVVFFIVQLVSGSRGALAITALVLLVLLAVVIGGLVWVIFSTASSGPTDGDLAITAGLVLPNIAIILVQWLIVRWRAPRLPEQPSAPRFGRGGQLS
jgi:hypothetical protein